MDQYQLKPTVSPVALTNPVVHQSSRRVEIMTVPKCTRARPAVFTVIFSTAPIHIHKTDVPLVQPQNYFGIFYLDGVGHVLRSHSEKVGTDPCNQTHKGVTHPDPNACTRAGAGTVTSSRQEITVWTKSQDRDLLHVCMHVCIYGYHIYRKYKSTE